MIARRATSVDSGRRWADRGAAVLRGLDRVIAWKIDRNQRAEAKFHQRRRQRRRRARQRADTRRAMLARVRRGWRPW